MWGREVGRMAGVPVPLQACEHFYVLTEAIDGLPGNLPVLREPDAGAYYKEDAGKLLIGCFEPVAKPWAVDGMPEDSEFLELPEDWDHFMPVLESAMRRVPALRTLGIRKFFNGPESFTPDDLYHLGEAPGLPGFFVACGFNSIGIQSAGGAGKALAEWMEAGRPTMDLWDVDIRRAQPFQATRGYLKERVGETLGLLYAMHWPYRQMETARGVRCSPLHERLAARNAFFGQTAGWERPLWFAPPGGDPTPRYSWKRQNFFPWVEAEHLAVRRRVGLLDLSSLTKLLVEGPDAAAVLSRVSANDIDAPVGRVVRTPWLNEAGGIEADVTVARWSETSFLVIGSAACQSRDAGWLRRHMPDGARCRIGDVTGAWAVLGIAGPLARDLLAAVTPDDVGGSALPFGAALQIEIGYVPVWAHRVSYTGELSFELYVPVEMARHVFDRLALAGEPLGMAPCGFLALDRLRLEKGFAHFGHDLSDETDPLDAGLGSALAWDKPGGFVGREALLRRRQSDRQHRRLIQLGLLDPKPLLYGDEPILRDGRIHGRLSSGAYGHWLGHAVGMGWLTAATRIDRAWLDAGSWEIEIAGERFAARASFDGLYDPTHARMKI
jgi:4-methylaminobutanoate oxidase (formaldehyde-forming)